MTHLPIETVKAIIALLAKVGGSEATLDVKTQGLMSGLCDLVAADYWVSAIVSDFKPDQHPHFIVKLKEGFRDDQLNNLIVAVDHPELINLTRPAIQQAAGRREHVTLTAEQFDPQSTLPTIDSGKLWESLEVGGFVTSWYPRLEDEVSVLAFFRSPEKPQFNEEETAIIHLLLSTVPWLHNRSSSVDKMRDFPRLSRRCGTVLNLLLEGCSRKEMASHLTLSVHTINDYVKQVYSFFDVRSQSQLLTRFRLSVRENDPN